MCFILLFQILASFYICGQRDILDTRLLRLHVTLWTVWCRSSSHLPPSCISRLLKNNCQSGRIIGVQLLHVSGFLHLPVARGGEMMTEEEIRVEKFPEIHLKLTLETFHFRVKDSLKNFLTSYTFSLLRCRCSFKVRGILSRIHPLFYFSDRRDKGSFIECFTSRSGYI